jgi:quinolinate synthase
MDISEYQTLEPAELARRVRLAKAELGPRLLILGHHYQRDEVLEHADLRGDSYGLSAAAAANDQCRAIVFCGVHFMAETADILANRPERLAKRGGQRAPVVLPDLEAGCSLADMAEPAEVERCWDELAELINPDELVPITYVNSTAELKAFCGRRGGMVCTSANARAALQWVFEAGKRALFFPDQHLGRNTAKAMGVPLERMPLWDAKQARLGGNQPEAIRRAKVILWDGFCCVHQAFEVAHIEQVRASLPGVKVVVHPECPMAVADAADAMGSTSKIIEMVESSPPGTRWAIGTEPHLVDRLRRAHPEQEIQLLSPAARICATMYRIDLPKLCWAVESLAAGRPQNVIEVEPETARWALAALQRMLAIK